MRFDFGDILRFTYRHQDTDASTGDQFKEVLVLHPNWNHKIHGVDLKRLSPAERTVLEAVLDPKDKDKPSRIPLVNDIRRKMDPSMLIRNPVAFYSRFVKPFLRGKDAYRQYIPSRMSAITKLHNASISGKKANEKPLFPGAELGMSSPEDIAAMSSPHAQEPQQTGGRSPIDIMRANAAKKGLK